MRVSDNGDGVLGVAAARTRFSLLGREINHLIARIGKTACR